MNNSITDDDFLKAAKSSFACWSIPREAGIKQISRSENAMFLITWGAERYVMRVHRTGYHTPDGVRSELAWMKALKDDTGVETPVAVPGLNGDLLQFADYQVAGEYPMVVLFEFIDGAQPEQEDLRSAFQHLGGITAHMHAHARRWERPSYFQRQVWDYDGAFGARPNWGDWRTGYHMDRGGRRIVECADAKMKARLHAYGTRPDRFGLIHSDFRLANLLISNGETKVLDFDDCGFGWFMYDAASTATFLENHEDIDEIIQAWIDGYRTVGSLSAEEIAEIPTFMMFRRLIIMGWAGSHPDTDLAREMGVEFTDGTIELAEKYLNDQVLRLV